jgi:phosphatidate cytidylyltransferase
MLKHRIIFGLLFGALFIGLIYLDFWASRDWPRAAAWTPPGLFIALASLVVIPLGLWEMRALLAREHVNISMRITVVAAMLCMLWPWVEQVAESLSASPGPTSAVVVREGENTLRVQAGDARAESAWQRVSRFVRTVKPHYLVPTILAASLVAAFAMHSRDQRVDGAMANAGGTLLAIVYLGVLPGFYLPICLTHSAWMMLAIVCVVKCADIGAFATGKAIGKHKLIPWLSPGKTVEGFLGGLALSGIMGALLAWTFHAWAGGRWAAVAPEWALGGGLVAGIILGAVGQLGDLLESLLKRDAGVKDSGVVPGFGGVLDILDSPLLAAPVAYWMLKLVLPAAPVVSNSLASGAGA